MTKLVTYLLEGGGLALAARGVWFAWTWWVARRDRLATIRAIEGRDEITEALEMLIEETPADYAQIIRIHNGGGNLEAGLPMYMSCVKEEKTTGLMPIKPQLIGLELDDHYRRLVKELLKVKDEHSATRDVDDPFLTALFNAMGAAYTRSTLLAINRQGIYFLRTTSRTAPLNDQKHLIRYRGALSVLRKHYK